MKTTTPFFHAHFCFFDLLNPACLEPGLIIWLKRGKNGPWTDIRDWEDVSKKAYLIARHPLVETRPNRLLKGKELQVYWFPPCKGGYVLMQEKLPNYVVPDLTDSKLKPYVSQCPREIKTAEASELAK